MTPSFDTAACLASAASRVIAGNSTCETTVGGPLSRAAEMIIRANQAMTPSVRARR